jgi:hypothetical protein
MKGKKHMKTVAMESFCVLEVILCWVVALPILLIAFLDFILGEKIFRRQFKHLHLTSPLAVISSVTSASSRLQASEVNQGRFLRAPNFPRYIWPDFLQYLCERSEMSLNDERSAMAKNGE